jgi:hypothetical protein
MRARLRDRRRDLLDEKDRRGDDGTWRDGVVRVTRGRIDEGKRKKGVARCSDYAEMVCVLCRVRVLCRVSCVVSRVVCCVHFTQTTSTCRTHVCYTFARLLSDT